MSNPTKIILPSIAVIVVFSLLMFPYIWQGRGVVVNIWDNLDSNVVWYKMLREQGKMFVGPGTLVEGFMTTTPRFSFPSGYNVEALLFYFFEDYTAYWINKLLISLIGFVGMVLLFSTLFSGIKWEVMGIGFIWATLAFYPHIGISVAGMPLVFWSFLNFRKGKLIVVSLVCLILYSFYSSFVLVGIFTLLILICCLMYWRIMDGKFSKTGLLGVLLMGFCYLVQESNLFYFLFLQDDFISHREEMDYRFNSFSNHGPWFFIKNGNHNGVFYWWGHVIVVAGILIYLLFNKQEKVIAGIPGNAKDTFYIGLVFLLLIPFLAAFLSLAPVINFAGDISPKLHSFNLLRITFLFPFFLFLILGFGLVHLQSRYKGLLIGLLLAINIFVYQFEWRNMLNNRFGFLEYRIPAFSEYYAQEQFDDIREYLGADWDKINIGNINIPPAIGVYNGFKAIDGYLPLYGLEYKKKFKEIIMGELEKDRELYEHFQYWGNKCYLQNATHPDRFDAYKWVDLEPVRELDFDFDLLKEGFNTPYLVSAVEIKHTRLQLMKRFIHEGSAWDIYLYKVQ